MTVKMIPSFVLTKEQQCLVWLVPHRFVGLKFSPNGGIEIRGPLRSRHNRGQLGHQSSTPTKGFNAGLAQGLLALS